MIAPIANFQRTLEIDPENVSAHHNLQLLYTEIGETELAKRHEALHLRYKEDDNAQGRAVRLAREKYPAANFAAEAVVRYPLHRPGAPGLSPQTPGSPPASAASRPSAETTTEPIAPGGNP